VTTAPKKTAAKAKKAPAKKTARKTTKPPTTAGKRGQSVPTGAAPAEPRPAWVNTTLSQFCSNAEDIEFAGGDLEQAGAFHRLCPIATHQASFIRHGNNGQEPKVIPERLTVCISDWHERHPACYVCKTEDAELHTTHPQCVDVEACAERAKIRQDAHPGWDRYRQYHEAAKAAETETPRERRPSATRPTSGRCEHCGEPTKGGRFVAGHDAKLKGDLIRAGGAGDVEAVVEAMFRSWYKQGRYPELEAEAFAIVQANNTDEWLAQRVANRLGDL
jgi:hypothetical protein